MWWCGDDSLTQAFNSPASTPLTLAVIPPPPSLPFPPPHLSSSSSSSSSPSSSDCLSVVYPVYPPPYTEDPDETRRCSFPVSDYITTVIAPERGGIPLDVDELQRMVGRPPCELDMN
jgi:hypothetical protein